MMDDPLQFDDNKPASPPSDTEALMTQQCMETFFDLLVQCWNAWDVAKYEHKNTEKLLKDLSEILLKGDYGPTVATAASLIQKSGRDLPASYYKAVELAKKYHSSPNTPQG